MPTITLPGNLGSLAAISDMVVEQAALAGLNNHVAYQLRLAVDELATNSIVHGYEEQGLTGDVTVIAELSDTALKITVEDAAVPFDPLVRDLKQIEETFDDPLHERPMGGLGVYFVLQAVDEFNYQRADGRNRNTVVVNRPLNFSTATANTEAERPR
jgi:anti-sigma regulatory factor (Ser/Thr protein kinase)